MSEFNGKSTLVTAGRKGLGRAIANRLRRQFGMAWHPRHQAGATLPNRLKVSIAKSSCRPRPIGRADEKIRTLSALSAFHLGSDCWRRRSQGVQERRQCGVVGRLAPSDAQRDLSRLWCDWANDHLGTIQTPHAARYERHAESALDQRHRRGHKIRFVDDARRETSPTANGNDFVKQTGGAFAVELHKRLADHTFQADNFLLCKSVGYGQRNGELVGIDHLFLEFRATVRWELPRKSQVDAAFVECGKLLVGVQLKQAQFDGGKFTPIGLHKHRQDRSGGRPEKANAQNADLATRRSLRELLRFIGATQDDLGLTQERSSCRGQLHAAFGAEQQLHSEFVFEIKDGLADCGLGNVEATRCFAVVQVLGNGGKVSEMAKFHGWKSYRKSRLLQANHTISTITETVRYRKCQRHEAEDRNQK